MVQTVGSAGDRQMFERIYRLLQMTPRQMQIDAGGFQVGMSQQHLNRGQIRAVLQQVGSKAVAAKSPKR
jgi:hypothetical protein